MRERGKKRRQGALPGATRNLRPHTSLQLPTAASWLSCCCEPWPLASTVQPAWSLAIPHPSTRSGGNPSPGWRWVSPELPLVPSEGQPCPGVATGPAFLSSWVRGGCLLPLQRVGVEGEEAGEGRRGGGQCGLRRSRAPTTHSGTPKTPLCSGRSLLPAS